MYLQSCGYKSEHKAHFFITFMLYWRHKSLAKLKHKIFPLFLLQVKFSCYYAPMQHKSGKNELHMRKETCSQDSSDSLRL